MNNIVLFDYSGTKDPTRIKEITETIRLKMRVVSSSMLEIGAWLIEAKSMMPEGTWNEWILQELDFSVRTAQRLMAVSNRFPELDNKVAGNIQTSAMYELTSSTTPDVVVDLAIKKAQEGEKVTRMDLADWRKKIRPVSELSENEEEQRKIIAYVRRLEKRIAEAGHWGDVNYDTLYTSVARILSVVDSL